MNVTAHVLFRRVVHGLVLSVLILDALVGLKVVRVDLLAEALKRIFPKKAREELYRVAHERDEKGLKPKRKARSQD